MLIEGFKEEILALPRGMKLRKELKGKVYGKIHKEIDFLKNVKEI